MKKPNIVHILANGKRVKTIEGHVIPADNAVYAMILNAKLEQGGSNGKWEKEVV